MSGHVYFIECGGRIKIGHSTDIPARMDQLASGNPFPLVLLGAVAGSLALERHIHKHMAAYRLNREWFRDHADVRAVLAALTEHGAGAVGFSEPAWEPKVRPPARFPDCPWEPLLDDFEKLMRKYAPLARTNPAVLQKLEAALAEIRCQATYAMQHDLEDDEVSIFAGRAVVEGLRVNLAQIFEETRRQAYSA